MNRFNASSPTSLHPAGRSSHERFRSSEQSLIAKAARLTRPTAGCAARVEREPGLIVIRLNGELDVSQLHRLEALRPQTEGSTPVLIDLRGLTFIDLAAIRELLRAKEEGDRHGRTLVLSGARGAVRRLFDLTGAQHLLCAPDELPCAL